MSLVLLGVVKKQKKILFRFPLFSGRRLTFPQRLVFDFSSLHDTKSAMFDWKATQWTKLKSLMKNSKIRIYTSMICFNLHM